MTNEKGLPVEYKILPGSINRLMPKSIHSVTSRCFELKILIFLMGYTFLNLK